MQKEVDGVHDFYPIVKTCEIYKFCRYSQRSEPDLTLGAHEVDRVAKVATKMVHPKSFPVLFNN